MALNLSHNSVFPTIQLENLAGFGNYMNFNWEDCIRERTERVSDDILDLLPSDPFDMDLSTTFTAFTSWLEDIENDLGLNSIGFGTDRLEVERGEDRLFAELNLVWNNALKFHPEVNNSTIQEVSIGSGKELWAGLCDGDDDMDELMGEYRVSSDEIHSDSKGEGDPHDALFFCLGYLGVKDLLSMERVCKSLCNAVQNDPLIWRSIHIDQPLSDKITDDALLQLTSRAKGTLQCLCLFRCLKITDSGLRQVLESNPGLTKLSVPGCLRLSVEGILCNLKAFKSAGKLGIKLLRIGGLCGISNKQFEELKVLLGADNHNQLSARKPRFYGDEQLYLSCNDDRAIDIEACPRCQQLRQVYDCPAESCQGKHQSTQLCRACILCIARCIHCGRCIDGCDYEETFCLDLLCLDCWKQLLNCQHTQDDEVDVDSSKCTAFHQQIKMRRHIVKRKFAEMERMLKAISFFCNGGEV